MQSMTREERESRQEDRERRVSRCSSLYISYELTLSSHGEH